MSVVAIGGTTPVERTARPRWLVPAIGAGVLVALQLVLAGVDRFPSRWYIHLADPIDDLQDWIQDNRLSHPLFKWFLEPFRRRVNDTLNSLTDLFLWLPWFTLPVVVFALIARTGRWRSAVFAGACMAFPGVVGLWDPAMETMSLMMVSVALAVVIGVPLGIWAALSARANRIMRPVLDAMQTVPSTAYLVPAVLLFSIGQVPATVATVIYALPPVVRLTALGIRHVPHDTVEAARMFGSSRRQLLTKVQLPQAIPSIVTGINQTINMALGIVVIASLVGAGGLGEAVLESLRLRAPGRGLVIGAAIVSLALVFDRVTRSFIERPTPLPNAPSRRRRTIIVAAGIAVAVVVARATDWIDFPVSWGTDFADPIDDAIIWIRDNVRWLTKDVNDFIVRELWVRNTGFLKNTVAWPVLVLGTAALGFWVKGWKLALFCGASVLGIGLVGLWDPAIDTLVQVLLAVVIAAVIALPLGIWLGRHPRAEAALVAVPRRAADDPVARVRDPVRHDLRRRHRARRHHRFGPVRHPARRAGQRARRAPGAGVDDRSCHDVRRVTPAGVVGRADPARPAGDHAGRQPGDPDGRGDGHHRRAHGRRWPRLPHHRHVHAHQDRPGRRGGDRPDVDGDGARPPHPRPRRTLPTPRRHPLTSRWHASYNSSTYRPTIGATNTTVHLGCTTVMRRKYNSST